MAGSSLLDPRARAAGNAHLAAADPALAGVLAANAPLRFARPRGSLFAHLCRVITAQQISVAAADAIHDRLVRACSRVNPAAVCALELPGLQRCGLSQAKALSLLQLAAGLRDGRHRLHALGRRSDDEVRRRLIEIRGIGPWSADMVLVFRLHRPDVLPTLDIGLRRAMERLYGLDPTASPRNWERQAHTIAQRWRPWRTLATRHLWAWNDADVNY